MGYLTKKFFVSKFILMLRMCVVETLSILDSKRIQANPNFIEK